MSDAKMETPTIETKTYQELLKDFLKIKKGLDSGKITALEFDIAFQKFILEVFRTRDSRTIVTFTTSFYFDDNLKDYLLSTYAKAQRSFPEHFNTFSEDLDYALAQQPSSMTRIINEMKNFNAEVDAEG